MLSSAARGRAPHRQRLRGQAGGHFWQWLPLTDDSPAILSVALL